MDIRTALTIVGEGYFDRYNRETQEHAEALQAVSDYAASLGVELRVSNNLPHSTREHLHGAGWALAWIKRDGGDKGAGVKAIQRLIAVADEWKQKIALFVMADDAALIPYYEKLGFKVGRRTREGTAMTRPAARGKQTKRAAGSQR
jgi:ribosomal protein S18 acetylase RimI-like enzyme